MCNGQGTQIFHCEKAKIGVSQGNKTWTWMFSYLPTIHPSCRSARKMPPVRSHEFPFNLNSNDQYSLLYTASPGGEGHVLSELERSITVGDPFTTFNVSRLIYSLG